jgi:hypothetical protein
MNTNKRDGVLNINNDSSIIFTFDIKLKNTMIQYFYDYIINKAVTSHSNIDEKKYTTILDLIYLELLKCLEIFDKIIKDINKYISAKYLTYYYNYMANNNDNKIINNTYFNNFNYNLKNKLTSSFLEYENNYFDRNNLTVKFDKLIKELLLYNYYSNFNIIFIDKCDERNKKGELNNFIDDNYNTGYIYSSFIDNKP